MREERQVVDYVTKDYEGFRQMMIEAIPRLAPDWTDTSQSDFGIVLLELLAQGLDVLSYYQDKAVNENIIGTAQRMDSVVLLSHFLGYEIPQKKPSKFLIKFHKHLDLIDTPITVPEGTKLCTEQNDIFETEETLIIPAGEIFAEVSAIHGESFYSDILGESTGEENQVYVLSNPNVLRDTITIVTKHNDGSIDRWKRVNNFLDSKTNDRHYTSKEDGETTIIYFSNSRSGLIPTKESKVIASYRSGGGVEGNVGIRTINEFYSESIEGIDFFHNEKKAYIEGKDSEDIETIRVKAPKFHRTNGRAVTKTDFEDLAIMVDGVEKAKLEESFDYRDIVYLYLINDKFEIADNDLQDNVRKSLEKVMLVKPTLEFKQPNIKPFNINIEIEVKDGYVRNEVIEELEATYYDAFSLKYMEFGECLKTFSLVYLAGKHRGIENAKVIGEDIQVGEYEILKLEDINIYGTGGVVFE